MNSQTVEVNNGQVADQLHVTDQLRFDFHVKLPIVVRPSAGQITSDAGLLPIRQFDARWRYTRRMAACLGEGLADTSCRRTHPFELMLRQRLFGIIAGYEDCNDHDTLRDDPVFKLVAGRLPEGNALASQPTLSRFENTPEPRVLNRLIDFHIATGVERLKSHHGGKVPTKIILDLDATDDPTHGQQHLTFFHREGTNLRFIVTNRANIYTHEDAMRCYDEYVLRGESEHRMDELKNGLSMDRLSCHRYMANFFRLMLHVAAMNLLNAQRDSAELPEVVRKGQPCTWRTYVVKVAATVIQSARRVLVELASNWPWWETYRAVSIRSNAFFAPPPAPA